MSSQDDIGMLWYGVSGVAFNPADPSEVLLNTATAAPLLSDHPRPLVATQDPQSISNSYTSTISYDASSVSHQTQMIYDPNTGDYVSQNDYMYESYDGYDEEDTDADNGEMGGNTQMLLPQQYGESTSLISEEDSSGNQKTKKPKVHQHLALKLKTPIAYQKDTDISAIPIMKEGMAVCKRCGAIGVKHAFYGKERKFCSLACARPPQFAGIKRSSSDMGKPLYKMEDSEKHREEVSNVLTEEKSLADTPPSEIVADSCSPTSTILKMDVQTTIAPLPLSKPNVFQAPNTPDSSQSDPELVDSFDWCSYLEDGLKAAPVSCFSHAPMAECWEQMSPGMKVEVSCRDESLREDAFWVATVISIAGYKAKLRYEGFVEDSSKDFWVDLCSEEVHPVGWCATQEKPLIPPKSIQYKYNDWKDFLMKRLTGARTLPTNFHSKIIESQKSRFRPSMNLEVVDKNRIAQMRVATVTEVIGKRLHLRYQGAPNDDNGFWCHEDASIIHPVGWSREVGHEIVASQSYHEKCMQVSYDPNDAAPELFLAPSGADLHCPSNFTEGMKLEAIDPLNLSTICVATVMKILGHNYLMIRIDSYANDNTCSDWFCYHSTSPCIFPAGFAEINQIPLTPPRGYEGEFSWFLYLNKSQAVAAPPDLFPKEAPNHGFQVDMSVEAVDLMDPRLICVGGIVDIKGRNLRIHFDGWEEDFDQWVDCLSPDIYPVGWCKMIGYKLEGPKVNCLLSNSYNSIPKKKIKGTSGKKGRPFGRRGGCSRGVENASPNPLNNPPPLPYTSKRGRKPRFRGVMHRPVHTKDPLSPEIDEYTFSDPVDSTELSFNTSELNPKPPMRGRRGRPRKKPLRISNQPNTKPQTTFRSTYPVEEDVPSDETSSGVASLADSDTSTDCWDMNDSTSNCPSKFGGIESSYISKDEPEPLNPTEGVFSKSDLSIDFFIKPSESQRESPIKNQPDDTAYREPVLCDSPVPFLVDDKVPKIEDCSLEEIVSSSVATQDTTMLENTTHEFTQQTMTVDANPVGTNLFVNGHLNHSEFIPMGSTCTNVHPHHYHQEFSANQLPPQLHEFGPSSTNSVLPSAQVLRKEEDIEPLTVKEEFKPFIPRIVGFSSALKNDNIKPKLWTPENVAEFLSINDCSAYCANFVARNIDGTSLLKLSQNDVLGLTGMKVGPSLKIHDLIQQLLVAVDPAQARYQASLLRRNISFGKS